MDSQTTAQGSPAKAWYVIGIVVIAALALWYYYSKPQPVDTSTESAQTSAVEQTTVPEPTAGDTTADISADLNQIPDDTAALNADVAASAAAVSGF